MPRPGFEPGILRPQRSVLITRPPKRFTFWKVFFFYTALRKTLFYGPLQPMSFPKRRFSILIDPFAPVNHASFAYVTFNQSQTFACILLSDWPIFDGTCQYRSWPRDLHKIWTNHRPFQVQRHTILLLAYPQAPWLMKPFPEGTRDPEEKTFNKELSRARVIVERAFGILKRRWRVLQKRFDSSLEFAIKCAVACIVLHNICVDQNDPWHDDGDDYDGRLYIKLLYFTPHSWINMLKHKKLLKILHGMIRI